MDEISHRPKELDPSGSEVLGFVNYRIWVQGIVVGSFERPACALNT